MDAEKYKAIATSAAMNEGAMNEMEVHACIHMNEMEVHSCACIHMHIASSCAYD